MLADRAQTRRLKTANSLLAKAVDRVRAGLSKEEAVFDGLAGAIVDQEVEAQGYLLRSGLGSAEQALQPLAESLGAALVKNPDLVLTRSASARTAVQAAVLASKIDRVNALKARYAAGLSALEELARQHAEAAKDKPLDLAMLTERVVQLDGLLKSIKAP